jgi:hypothetical protein
MFRLSLQSLLLFFALRVYRRQFMLVPHQALTCFFDAIPETRLQVDVIAEVVLTDTNEKCFSGEGTATIARVLKTSDARVPQGDQFVMRYLSASCGPCPKNGDRGTILAKAWGPMPKSILFVSARSWQEWLAVVIQNKQSSGLEPMPARRRPRGSNWRRKAEELRSRRCIWGKISV